MALSNQTSVIQSVRDLVDQIVYTNTEAIDDESALESGSSRFSDMAIAQFIDSACRYASANVRSTYLEEWLVSVTPPNIPVGAIRLAEGSVNVNGVDAVRRSYSANRRLAASLRSPTDEFPAYAYSDFEWTVFGDTDNPSGSTGEFVTVASREERTNSYTVSSPPNVVTLTDGSGEIFDTTKDLGAFLRLENEVVVITSFGNTLWAFVEPNPTAGTGIVTWDRPAINSMDKRLESMIVARSAELIFGASERPDLAEIAGDMVEREMAPLGLNFGARS